MVLKSLFKPKVEGTLMRKDIDMELFKHFRVLKVLGKGSYSTVYKVERLSDGRFYALKQTDISTLNPRERKDMVNEVRLLASLMHPNLMIYYEAFCDKHQLCIVTDLAKTDLGTFIDKRAESGDLLPERQVWSYFIQIALGLQYLHHNHVLHRDLKPQNVLVMENGMLKIADLGISQVLDHVFTRHLIGTPTYMSPEMYQRDPYSYSADVWALGCILFELCALKPLFMAHDEKAIKQKVLSGILEPLPPRYSIDLWDVMRQMLTADPALRPTIDEVLQMPVVRAHMSLVPGADRRWLEPGNEGLVQLLQPIRIPRLSADWEGINVFLPPAKYSTGPSVVDALRMKGFSSCPDFVSAEAAAAADLAVTPGTTGSGGGALFGPSTDRARATFGQITAAPSEYFSGTRRSTEGTEPGGGMRKMPSTGNLRQLARSNTVSVGEVFNSRRDRSPVGDSSVRGGRESASSVVDGGGGPSGKPVDLDAKEVARVVAEAWERARGRGDGSVALRRSVTVGQVLLNHVASDDFQTSHDRHQQHLEQMQQKADLFKPSPVVFCPPRQHPPAHPQPLQQQAVAGAKQPAGASAPAYPAATGPPSPAAVNAAAGALVAAAAVTAAGGISPRQNAARGAAGSPAAKSAARKGKSVSWEGETPVVKREKNKLFSFLKKLAK